MAGALPESLAQIDPAAAWQVWEPSQTDPWNLKWAAHLYRRAAFGASWMQLQEAVKNGVAATLTRLLAGQPGADDRERLVERAGTAIASKDDADELRGWWIYLFLQSLHPLREKLTLFWHNHFATSIAKVNRTDLMFRQNCLLRRHALGKFQPFLLDISRDPAMLIWLDSNTNVKGAANENYARELMELFTLGVGHYTENDVREAARAFTGWRTDGDEFEFAADLHDDADKTFLARRGRWNGDDVIRIILARPDAARFVVRRLYHLLISESENPPDALLEPLAQSFRQSDYDISLLLKSMLSSRLFFSAHAYRKRIKSPVEFMLGILQGWSGVPPSALVSKLEAMGQSLFAPPNVKGWPGGKAWLNTATILARNTLARELANNEAPQADGKKDHLGDSLLRNEKVTEPARAANLLIDLHLQGDIGKEARVKLTAFLAEGKPKGDAFYARVREAVAVIWTMPEYQLA
ncbi:MAG TPA: DUF1800 domain-containing protein [Gemmataceae bacterium]|nr:DUF1800 domain-containing protein [Gemmataceae bacterium]